MVVLDVSGPHLPRVLYWGRDLGPLSGAEVAALPLAAEQMKITHSAVRLLFDDLQVGQASQREILRGILDKLPDEHTMRAIVLP